MFEKTNFDNFLKSKLRIGGVNALSNEFLYFGPMSLFHAIFSKGHHEWKLGLEIFHIILYGLSDRSDMGHGLVLKVLVCIDNVPKTFFNKLFRSVGIDGLELIVHPNSDISVPSVDDRPQCIIWGKILSDLLQSGIIGLLSIKQHLSRVELS
jgi:hypothetical protein